MFIDWLPQMRLTTDPEAKSLLLQAYKNAKLLSNDPNTRNGAVIVPPNGGPIISCGANYFPDGLSVTPERLERPLKYQFMEHAERSAIYSASKSGVALLGSVMYCPWYACTDCARGIICSGIRRVVGHKATFDRTPERWQETIIQALKMLLEAGVICEAYEGDVSDGKIHIAFNDQEFTP